MEPVFVVGSGRCGSTLLSSVLRSHPAVVSLSELLSALRPTVFPEGILTGARFWTVLSEPRRSTSLMIKHDLLPSEFLYPRDGTGRFSSSGAIPPICTHVLPHLSADPDALFDELSEQVPGFAPAPVGAQFRALFEWFSERLGRPVVVERSGASLQHVSELADFFPDAKFVHIVRSGAACALSMREFPTFRLHRVGERLRKVVGFDPYLVDEEIDTESVPAELRPLLPDRFDRKAFLSFPLTAQEFGWTWTRLILHGLRCFERLDPARLCTVRYESLTADPRREVGRLATFLGLGDSGGSWMDDAVSSIRPAPPRVAPPEESGPLARSTDRGERRLRRFERDRSAEPATPPTGTDAVDHG